jgi:hypothetical protein
LTPPEPKDGRGYEYKPDFEETPSLEVPPQPPAVYDPDDPEGLDTGDFDDDEDLREGYEGPYNSDEDEGGGSMKRLQIGCGVFILLALAMAIVVPVFGSFGGDDGNSGPGAPACDLFRELVEDSQGEGGVLIDSGFVDRVARISEEAVDAELPIRDSSAALHIASTVVLTGQLSEEGLAEINTQSGNLIQACRNGGYFFG